MSIPEELQIVQVTSPERYLFGDIEVKSASDGKMRMSGFVSTPKSDLAQEVVDVESFEEYLGYYKRNPIYCYNHDKSCPIGRVENPELIKVGAKTGLYLDNIVLSAIPVVKEVIWPLVTDKVLTQQSIGFLSLKGAYNGNIYHHQKVYLLESSLVPIACNPEATIDTIKSVFGKLPDGYEQFETLADLVGAFEKGILRLPSEVRKVFSMSTKTPPLTGDTTMNTLESKNSEATNPDFADAVVLVNQEKFYDPEGVEQPKPHKNEKGYVAVCDMIHAAKSETRGSYLFQIAVPTEKGFKYDFKHLATSMSRILGGNGGAHFSREQKSAIIERIAEGYEALEKQVPVVEFNDGVVAVDKLLPEVLETLAYKDVTFQSDEKQAVRLAFFEKDLKSVIEGLASMKKDGEIPDEVKESLKSIGGYVDISIYASVRDPQALEFMSMVINLLEETLTSDSASNDVGIFMNAPDGLRKFATKLNARADELEAATKKEAPTTVTDEIPVLELDEIKLLLEAESQLASDFI